MKDSKKKKILKILLVNLLGVFNGLLCGILIPLVRMHNLFSISQIEIFFGTLIILVWYLIISLIQNLIIVNIIAFFLNRTNIKKAALAIVLIISILSGYSTIFILSIPDIHTAFELIPLGIPDELWITVPVYLIGFYFLYIRNIGKEAPKTVEDKTSSVI